MSDALVSRLGQVNGSGDDRALFLVRYAGEVLEEFDIRTVFVDKHTIRTIDNGRL